ncbi:hypothetical protein ABEB36_011497 [Hypothenemus hampei]|uniref:protein-tyrosine-phosphatase n=1 Tax=Hypothenemus hampei TaxID=57062 RepID=A0ABD1EFN8_HYPHA
MWDSLSHGSCDTCQFSRNKNKLSPMENTEESLYDGPRTIPVSCSASSPHCPSRRLLEDIDASSRDSGYGMGFHGESGKFLSYASPNRVLSSSFGSMEEDFLEDFTEIDPLEDSSPWPKDFNKLIKEPLVGKTKENKKISSPKDTVIRPLFRRAVSLQNTPLSKEKVRLNLFSNFEDDDNDKENRSNKRSEPPTELENTLIKRSKMQIKFWSTDPKPAPMKALYNRQFSATEESIMCAVQKSSTQPDLIGDFSKSYCLPLTNGRHQDLKSITPGTLAKLMKGEFKDTVENFKVIDCRYPYEFKGGHIDGAVNIYTKDQISQLLEETRSPASSSNKRNILVFHCEFSSERGPNLYRYLRKEDRTKNMKDYPLLNYPEIYLLEGGYKSFFQQFSEMCVPVAYKQMLDPDHGEDLRHFRQKSKTCNADIRKKPTRSIKRF